MDKCPICGEEYKVVLTHLHRHNSAELEAAGFDDLAAEKREKEDKILELLDKVESDFGIKLAVLADKAKMSEIVVARIISPLDTVEKTTHNRVMLKDV